jgi:hypothetical protein
MGEQMALYFVSASGCERKKIFEKKQLAIGNWQLAKSRPKAKNCDPLPILGWIG